MRTSKLALAAALAVGSVALSGCAYGMYGDGYGGYGPYSGVSVGYGGYGGAYCANGGYYGSRYGGYYDPRYYGYYDPRYSYGGYGSYYGSRYSRYSGCGMPYYGWNDGFYYPGSGFYVYDRNRTRYRWSDAQRKYWEWRRNGSPSATGKIGRTLENWADFQNQGQATTSVRTQSVAPTGSFRTRGERMRDRASSVTTDDSTFRRRSSDSTRTRSERAQRRERTRPED